MTIRPQMRPPMSVPRRALVSFAFAAMVTFAATGLHSARAADSGTGASSPSAVQASSFDWPQFRGPNRDGISKETGLLKEWPKDGPPLAWKAKGIGGGYSLVSVANGRIYTMGDNKDGSSYVHALEEKTGKILWSTKLGRAGGGIDRDPQHIGTRCTPTVDGERLYVLGQYGDLACLTTDGKEVWRTNLVEDYGGEVQQWAYSESPLIDGNKVIVTPGGRNGTLLALDKNTGKSIWESKEWTDETQYSSAIIATIGGVRQYIQQTEKTVAGVAAEDGKLLWSAKRPEGRTAVVPTPIEKDGFVFISAGYGAGGHLFKVTPPATAGGKFSAELVYKTKDLENHHGGVILFNDHLYTSRGPGVLTCADFKTGKVVWSDRSVGKGSILIADGKIYLRSEKSPGKMALVEASPDGYKEISTFTPPDASGLFTWPHPVIANGKLYLRDQDVLLCYDVKAK
jgi:outer membrane protein assembly factor BamB